MKLSWSTHMFRGLCSKFQRHQFSTHFTQVLQVKEEALVNLHQRQKGWNIHIAPLVVLLQTSRQKGPLGIQEVNSCFQQGLLGEVAWSCVQLNFEHHLGQRFKNLCKPAWSWWKIKYISLYLTMLQFTSIFSCPTIVHLRLENLALPSLHFH